MVFHFDLWAAVAYAAVFLWLIFRAEKFQWFWGCIILWLAVGFLGAQLLPGMWGITHVGPLFIPHFYLTVASAFFFIDHWRKDSDGLWVADTKHPLLSLFAVSNAVMSLAFAMLAAMVYYRYPQGITLLAAPALLKVYALSPSLWFAVQLVLMAVFYAHRTLIMKQNAAVFSFKQLQGGYLLVFLVLAAVSVAVMLEGRI